VAIDPDLEASLRRKRESNILIALAGTAADQILVDRGCTDPDYRIAIHEASHAVMMTMRGRSWPAKISIVPEGGALGFVVPAPPECATLHEAAAVTKDIPYGQDRFLETYSPGLARNGSTDMRHAILFATWALGSWKGVRELIRIKLFESRSLLLSKWNLVEELARLLLEQKIVDAVDFADLLERRRLRRLAELEAVGA
jgi:hypothetical protein